MSDPAPEAEELVELLERVEPRVVGGRGEPELLEGRVTLKGVENGCTIHGPNAVGVAASGLVVELGVKGMLESPGRGLWRSDLYNCLAAGSWYRITAQRRSAC